MDHYSPKIDQRLLEAYEQAIYRLPFAQIDIKVNEPNAKLDTFLMDNNAYSWAFISAYNPASKVLSKEENEQRHQQLLNQLAAHSMRYTEAVGMSQRGDWPEERSVLVLDIPLTRAQTIAQQFGQLAIVYGRLKQAPELVVCVDKL